MSSAVEQLTSRELRSEARAGVSRVVADGYEELFESVKSSGVELHSPADVRALLDL